MKIKRYPVGTYGRFKLKQGVGYCQVISRWNPRDEEESVVAVFVKGFDPKDRDWRSRLAGIDEVPLGQWFDGWVAEKIIEVVGEGPISDCWNPMPVFRGTRFGDKRGRAAGFFLQAEAGRERPVRAFAPEEWTYPVIDFSGPGWLQLIVEEGRRPGDDWGWTPEEIRENGELALRLRAEKAAKAKVVTSASPVKAKASRRAPAEKPRKPAKRAAASPGSKSAGASRSKGATAARSRSKPRTK